MGGMCRLLVVAALVALAGCSSAAAPSTPTATGTVTAAPVPTATPSTFLAPGVTARGVVDPVALVAAHRSTLRGTTVTVRVEESRRYANGSLRWRRTATQRVDATGREVRSHYVAELRGSVPAVRFPDANHVERYTFGDGSYHRYRLRSGGTWYVGGASSDVRPLDAGLVLLFRTVETRVVGRETGDRPTRYRLAGTEVVDPAVLERVLGGGPRVALRNVSLEATVDARGTVHEYRLSYTLASDDGVLVRGQESVRFTDVGTTTVERPGWYGAAVNATGDWGDDGA